MSNRKFAAEGFVHLHSSQAVPLYPSEIYLDERPEGFREALEGCNLYMITARPRMMFDASTLSLSDDGIRGELACMGPGDTVRIQFLYPLSEASNGSAGRILGIECVGFSSYVLVRGTEASFMVPAYAAVAHAQSDPGESADLEVLYIGKGIGKAGNKLAIDRLKRHSTFQRILADTHTHHPGLELVVIMFRYEHSKVFVSSGGDLNLVPTATEAEELMHFRSMSSIDLSRSNRVALAEAALINYFQPVYNDTFRKSDFAARRRMLLVREMDRQGLTGIMVEICTENIRSRLKTDQCSPLGVLSEMPGEMTASSFGPDAATWRHTHIARIPLTTSEERNTFLHGMKWLEPQDVEAPADDPMP